MLFPRDKSGYLSFDTIAAIATQVGGAISIVRVSGEKAFSTLTQLTGILDSNQAEARKLARCQLHSSNGTPLDDALYVRFISPESYTGENLVEYHLHGSSYIAHQLMESLIHFGIRQALPGEFSFRAVRNGKMSLFQAQAVADLIGATNSEATSLALEKMSGKQNEFLEKLGTDLRQLAVLGEVGIDFSDQDIEEVSLPRLKIQVQSLLSTLETLHQSFRRGIRVQEGVRVAFIGLPNAGKSSFFNTLLQEDRSIVSDIEGTTRDVVSEKLTLRGKHKSITLRLEDTAGLRDSENVIEKIGIEKTQRVISEADLILFLVDATTSPFEAEIKQWKELKLTSPNLSSKTIGVFTKIDLLGTQQKERLHKVVDSFDISQWLMTSSVTTFGVSDAAESIVQYCDKWTSREKGEVILTRLEHSAAVKEAIEHLQRALKVDETDLFASDIRQALTALTPLIGETVPDDILGKIFSDFCIGK